jgi:hypothetical protein
MLIPDQQSRGFAQGMLSSFRGNRLELAAKYLELSPCHFRIGSMDMIPPQTILLPLTRDGLRLAGHTTNKLKANPESKRTHESAAIRYRAGLQRDCTQMVDLL